MDKFFLREGMSKAYGLYARSVIRGRALPDIRDGLKPVQRRILYAMYESGHTHEHPFKKSARIVGEVVGKYHPHGTDPVYGAMVRLAQDFVMSLCLIEGQGNFGSIDGDNPASMRYTEARLAQVSNYLLQDYEKNTVPMRLNYDESLEIPAVLPAQFPNLLVNGSSGIAVGVATSIPPHNLGEVLDAVIAMVDNDEMSLSEVMQYIKGPDFPSGGAIYLSQSLVEGYTHGKGRVILKGSIKQEQSKGKNCLIIDSMPYQVSKPKLIERIVELIEEGTLDGISDVRDESGRSIRIVLELKKDSNPEILEQRIFAKTPLQIAISLNMVAIDDERPKLFGLVEMIKIFLHFREDVVIKRAEYILKKVIEKAHIVWGLALATTMLDEIIKTIRASENVKDAEDRLRAIAWSSNEFMPILEILGDYDFISDPYHFSQAQAKGILALRLQKLTKLERTKLLDELAELGNIIREQKKIITDRAYRKELMKGEFRFLKDKFALPRRTQVLTDFDIIDEDALIDKEDIVIMLTVNGYLKRIKLEEYRLQNRGGKGKIGHKKLDDPIINIFMTDTHADILCFTTLGKVFSLKAHQIPEGSANSRGRAAVNLFKLEPGEKFTTVLPLNKNFEGTFVFVTKNGTIRRNKSSDFENIRSNGKIAMKLDNDNALHSVLAVEEGDDLLLTSSNGNSIRFSVSDVRIFESRVSQGVKAMNLEKNDYIIGVARATENPNAEILCITENGIGKRSSLSEYRKIKRGGKGCKTMNVNAKTGQIVEAMYIEPDDEILLMTRLGQAIRTTVSEVRKTSRVTSGVILMKLPKDDKITQAIRLAKEDIEEDLNETESNQAE
jgi:DNA gyrase subunit A